MDIKKIRNFSIIAHIDHGKSTLADRILEFTKTVDKRQMKEQVLDDMDLERERGITIKAKSVRIKYKNESNEEYILNLIDTPGHVDFSYEVSRSLAATEGALLIVDASQGIEAQTFVNVNLAESMGLTIIPVINKIDLPNADIEGVRKQIEDTFSLGYEPLNISAKTGLRVKDVLDAIIQNIPAPTGDENSPLACLIFDSVFDSYRGVIVHVRVLNGIIKPGMKIEMFSSKDTYEVLEVGYLGINMTKAKNLKAGEVGYVIAGIKELRSVKIGDTIIDKKNPESIPHPGYKPIKPFVFVGLYTINTSDYELLKVALEKLTLNDSSLTYQGETSSALGFGFRCGFLGLLHMEIIKERLEREYNLNLIITSPNVIYKGKTKSHKEFVIDNPAHLQAHGEIEEICEPYILAKLICPKDMVGPVMQICQDKRGIYLDMHYIGTSRVVLEYELPLAEILYDFYDNLKSISKGYASFDYEHIGYRPSTLVKLEILINQEPLDAFTFLVHKEKALYQGRRLIERLRKLIPRQMFEVALQARVNGKILVRDNIKAIRKDVIAKCYGGDISRKRKLLEKQKEGKKKMKQLGKIAIPQEVFSAVLKLEKE